MSRKPWWPLALLALLIAGGGCGEKKEEPMPEPARGGPAIQGEANVHVAYGGTSPQQVLDLFPAKRVGPLVVFVHGGAWQSGSREEFRAVATRLQKGNVASAIVDYRLSPSVRHPAHAEDVAHALAWLAAHSKENGYDPKRIFVVGHSAGAHIAGTIATTPKLLALARPAGFVGLEGIYDVPQLAERWPKYPDWFLKKAFGDERGWAGASPTRAKVASRVPWLLVHSKADELVDVPQTEEFARHLRSAGVRVDVFTPDQGSHDGVVKGLAEADSEVAGAIMRFVDAGTEAAPASPRPK